MLGLYLPRTWSPQSHVLASSEAFWPPCHSPPARRPFSCPRGTNAAHDDPLPPSNGPRVPSRRPPRSEEHTSELQSHSDLHSFPHDALPISPPARRPFSCPRGTNAAHDDPLPPSNGPRVPSRRPP